MTQALPGSRPPGRPDDGASARPPRSALAPAGIAALSGLIALLEYATPPQLVFGYLYVIPLLLGAPQRSQPGALRFLGLCCLLTLLNMVVPQIPADWPAVLLDRLLVCLALAVTTGLCLRNRHLLDRQVALQVRLAQTDLRRDVIATLAHDLKTPVLGTIATARLLARDGAAAEGSLLRRGVEAILGSQERSLRLIEDLLRIFQADAEGLRLSLSPCHLSAVTQEAIAAVGAIAREREVTLIQTRTTERGSLQLPADPTLLRRLLENLLLNAIHHSLRGERVWIGLERLPEEALISVSDRGRGFEEASLPHLFERFYQADPERRGSGLGLYLCRQIAEAHGGSIRARNLAAGGACLEVLLPLPRGAER